MRCFTYVFSLNLQGSLMKWELFSLLHREGDLRPANVFIYIYFIYIGILFQKIFQGQNNDWRNPDYNKNNNYFKARRQTLERKQSNVEQGVHKTTFLIQSKNGWVGHMSMILKDKKMRCFLFCDSNALKKILFQIFGNVSLPAVMHPILSSWNSCHGSWIQ